MGKFSKFLFLSLFIHASLAAFFYFWPASLFLNFSSPLLFKSSLQVFQMGAEVSEQKKEAVSTQKKTEKKISLVHTVAEPVPFAKPVDTAFSASSGFKKGEVSATTGNSGKASGGASNTLALIRKKIESAKRYPEAARIRAQEGVVFLRFKLGLTGNVESLSLLKSSGFKILDEEALATVKRAAPFPYYEDLVETSLRFKLEE